MKKRAYAANAHTPNETNTSAVGENAALVSRTMLPRACVCIQRSHRFSWIVFVVTDSPYWFLYHAAFKGCLIFLDPTFIIMERFS
jgi:hypothetical protein